MQPKTELTTPAQALTTLPNALCQQGLSLDLQKETVTNQVMHLAQALTTIALK